MYNFGDIFENEIYTQLNSRFANSLSIFSIQHILAIEKSIKENSFNFPHQLLQSTLDNLNDIKNIILLIYPNQITKTQTSPNINNIFTLIFELSSIIDQANHIKKGAIGVLFQKIVKLTNNIIKNICNHLSTRKVKIYRYM